MNTIELIENAKKQKSAQLTPKLKEKFSISSELPRGSQRKN